MLGRGLRLRLGPEPVLGPGQRAGVWVKLWEEAGFVALAGAEALNSCVQVGWALQVVWVWGAALLVCRELGMGSPEAGVWAALL